MVHLKFRSDKRLGDFYFPDGWYAECYIDTLPERPEYPISEDARDDQEEDMHIIFQRYEKRGRLSFVGPEYMADAISLLPLMDEVYVDGSRVYDVVCDINWNEEFECLAEMDITYLTDKIIKTL